MENRNKNNHADVYTRALNTCYIQSDQSWCHYMIPAPVVPPHSRCALQRSVLCRLSMKSQTSGSIKQSRIDDWRILLLWSLSIPRSPAILSMACLAHHLGRWSIKGVPEEYTSHLGSYHTQAGAGIVKLTTVWKYTFTIQNTDRWWCWTSWLYKLLVPCFSSSCSP